MMTGGRRVFTHASFDVLGTYFAARKNEANASQEGSLPSGLVRAQLCHQGGSDAA